MTILILDTETTNVQDPEPIEIAYIDITFPELEVYKVFERKYKPENPISFGAMAVHNIIPEDLEFEEPCNFTLSPEVEYLIGHNIDFDWKAIGSPEVKRICTLAIARYLLPEVDSHSQSALSYYFSDNLSRTRELLKEAHSALADIENCLILFKNLLDVAKAKEELSENASIEEVYAFSEKCRLPKILTFGKYRGSRISDIPMDYKLWLLRQDDIDPYLRKALGGK